MDSFKKRREGVQRSSSTRSSISFLEQRLRILTIKRPTSESSDDKRGPLGLNLLHQPTETHVDFIFCHGLRGGSRKTWSFSDDSLSFWPKEWLPHDPAFKNVRIHSFGYNSDWGERRENPLNVHDFGRSLIEEIHNCQAIREDPDTPIVLIGHSLGGLVIKKACIISRQDPTFQGLAPRIHSMYFLATPHRGSKMASVLNNILRASVTHGARHFVSNLEAGSEAIQVLNDEFRHYYQGIQLYSFYESVPMNVGYANTLIVDRESATLGYQNERSQLLNADHRGVCKFKDGYDSNYQTLRSALVLTVDDIRKIAASSKQKAKRSQMRILSEYLNTSGKPEDELSNLEEARLGVEGSCEWLAAKESFQHWQFDSESPKYFWLSGKPATGKSVLAGYVVNRLEATGDCSFYFFKHSDKVRSSVSGFLRSIAHQMASFNSSVREKLIEIQQDDPHLEDNVRTIWRKVFVGGIFRTTFHQPNYWVIDALDECRNEGRNYAGLFSLMAKIEESVPLKVFITSRMSPDLEKLLTPLTMVTEQMSVDDSLQDIRAYCEANSPDLPVKDELALEELINRIVEKSAGCFLWAVLVVRQLQDVYSVEETQQVLEEVPEEMEDFYMRNLENLSQAGRNKRLAKTVIKWVITASRPLSTDELKDAIKLDINDTVSRDLAQSLPYLCGQFVYVDKHSKVQIVHATARDFLTRQGLESEFAISKEEGHFQLAVSCLKYLAGDEMKTQRRRSNINTPQGLTKSALADYACTSFSEHVFHSGFSSDGVLQQLSTFLRTNVLSWIEYIAQGHNLDYLNQAARHFKVYLEHRAKFQSPLSKEVQIVNRWATDLTRIVAEFGPNLRSSPAAIQHLIPPLCPPNSIIYSQFGSSPFGLRVLGLSSTDWQDRVFSIYYRDNKVSTVTCRDGRFAVGLFDGSVIIYYTSTCQEIRTLKHGEPLKVIRFGTTARLLASSGSQFIKLWDVTTGSNILKIFVASQPIALAFDEDETSIIAATRSNQVTTWNTKDGSLISDEAWTDGLGEVDYVFRRAPSKAEISMEHKMLAIIYRSMPVILWDLESNTNWGSVARPTTRRGSVAASAMAAIFNPNPDVNLLAVTYMDGELALFDTYHKGMVASVVSDAEVLAASPDGRTLVSGDSSGKIYLFDFETLQLLYWTAPTEYAIRSLSFTSDGLRFFDVRGRQCNVWEPSVLVRKDVDDDMSTPSNDSIVTTVEGSNDVVRITAISLVSNGEYLLCGKDDGHVDVYETGTGKQIQKLYSHVRNIGVSLLAWNECRNLVASIDMSSRFQVLRLDTTKPSHWTLEEKLLDERSDRPISQIMLSPDGSNLLVSTPLGNSIWNLHGKGLLRSIDQAICAPWKWIMQPSKPSELLLLHGSTIRIFEWECLDELSSPGGIQLQLEEGQTLDLNNAVTSLTDLRLGVKVSSDSEKANASHSFIATQILIFDLSKMQHGDSFITPIPCLPKSVVSATPRMDTLVDIVPGTIGGNILIFITESGWLSSINLDVPMPHESFIRHFPLPFDWLSTRARTAVEVTDKKDLIFVKDDEIAVVKNALDNIEVVSLRPKLTSPAQSTEMVPTRSEAFIPPSFSQRVPHLPAEHHYLFGS